MKKIKTYFSIVLLTLSVQINAQLINMNPDPNGEPWWSGDGILPSPEELALIPELIMTPEALATLLPYKVYNNELMYFPPIFLQEGYSCVHAAEIGYNFTYEINRFRNVAAGDWNNYKENCYHYLYTYNFVNNGSGGTATPYFGGFDIIMQNGCPSYDVYYDPSLNTSDKFIYWMTGYDKYFSGMYNRITSPNWIFFDSIPLSLDNLKHWLFNHGTTGDDPGGLAIIAVLTVPWNVSNTIPLESPEEPGDFLITQWGTNQYSGHALTIVGYNDEIWCFDINNDGEYTIDEDVDGDGDVDLFDYEKGAFKIANSWGPGWRNEGYIFVPYKLMAQGLQIPNLAYLCKVQEEYEPLLSVKASVEYPWRSKLQLRVGYASNANQNDPLWHNYLSFKYQGGHNNMRGAYTGPIEAGLNYGYWFLNNDVGKIFFSVTEIENITPDDGTIGYFSIIDNRWGEVFELYCDETNVSIINNDTTVLSIDYDIIPHEIAIDEDLSLFSNMVSRFTSTVANGATLTVEDGVNIDMYNSEIHINAGSSLVLEDNVNIVAKSGFCKLVIDGNVTIGSHASFLAETDAKLQIECINPLNNITIDYAIFINAAIISYSNHITLSNSSFTNSHIDGYNGNFDITGSDFNSSFIHIANAIGNNKSVNISGECSFIGPGIAAIEIDNYPDFKIDQCIIRGFQNAVDLYNCGYGKKFQQISNCEINNNSKYGITIYLSSADIMHNIISSNGLGIRSFDHSVVHIEGENEEVTQAITDNDSYELYASQASFPQYFHWNLIQDDFNEPDDPMVKYAGNDAYLDVRNNCWGNTFDPLQDLEPSGCYNWNPVWLC
jgi:hypothetical protein